MLRVLNFRVFPVAVLIMFLCVMIAQGLMAAFLPLYSTRIFDSPLFTGGLYSAYFMGVFLGSFKIEKWLDSVSIERLTPALLAMLVFLSACAALMHTPVVWILVRFVVGVCTGGSFIIVELYALTAQESQRRLALSMYFFTLYGGMTIGAALLNLYSPSTTIDAESAGYYFLTCILFQALAVVCCAFMKRWPVSSVSVLNDPIKKTVLKLKKPMVTVCVGGALVGSATAHVAGFARAMQYSMQSTSIFVCLAIVGGALMCMPATWLANRQGDMRAAFIMSVVGVVCDSMMSVFEFSESGPVFLVALVAVGSGMPLYMLGLSRASLDSRSTSEFVRFASILGVSFSAGAIIGPILTGAVVLATSKGLFVTNGAMKAVLMCFLLVSGALRDKKIHCSVETEGGMLGTGLSIIFTGAVRRSLGKRRRKRITKGMPKSDADSESAE